MGGIGGGYGGSSSMLRLVGKSFSRAAAASSTAIEPISSSSVANNNNNQNNKLSPSTSNNNNCNATLTLSSSVHCQSISPTSPSAACIDDYFDWMPLDEPSYCGHDPQSNVPQYGFDLGPVPSLLELDSAVSALTQVVGTTPYSQLVKDKYAFDSEDIQHQISGPTDEDKLVITNSVKMELDWKEPSPHLSNSSLLRPYESGVYEALRMLQTDTSVKRMVLAISSDVAVWDAVVNNEVVRELRETYHADKNVNSTRTESNGESNPTIDIVRWVFDNTAVRVMELFETVKNLVNSLFKPPKDEKKEAGSADPFEERLRTSFMLSIIVLMIVVVTRAQAT